MVNRGDQPCSSLPVLSAPPLTHPPEHGPVYPWMAVTKRVPQLPRDQGNGPGHGTLTVLGAERLVSQSVTTGTCSPVTVSTRSMGPQ